MGAVVGLAWSKEEDDVLRRMWPGCSSKKTILAELPGRTYCAVIKRALKLGITRPCGFRCREVFGVETIPELSIAWLAGFVDGEGTITLDRSRELAHPFLSVTNTDLQCLTRIKDMIGYGCIGKVTQASLRHKQAYRFRINSMLWVEAVVRRLRPHLIVKAEQAELVLDFIRCRKHGLLTKDDMAWFVRKARQLNARGPKCSSEP